MELADGSQREMPFTTVLVRLQGREAPATALIAPVGTEPFLGARRSRPWG